MGDKKVSMIATKPGHKKGLRSILLLLLLLSITVPLIYTVHAYMHTENMYNTLSPHIVASAKIVKSQEPIVIESIKGKLVANYVDKTKLQEITSKYSIDAKLIASIQEIRVNDNRLLILINKDGFGPDKLPIVIDANSGEHLEAKLVLVKKVNKTEKVKIDTHKENVTRLLERLAEEQNIPEKTRKEIASNYTKLEAVRVSKIYGYILVAKLPKKGYVPLAYYLQAMAGFAWYINGNLVHGVYAEGLFYVDPGNVVYLVADYSHYTVNIPYSACSFSHYSTSTPVAVSVRADGVAALLDCPVTTKVNAWAVATVDINGGFTPNANGNKWIAIGCECNSYP